MASLSYEVVVGGELAGTTLRESGFRLAALLVLVTGALTPGQARDAIDLNLNVLIAAAFGLGAAIETTGLAAAGGSSSPRS